MELVADAWSGLVEFWTWLNKLMNDHQGLAAWVQTVFSVAALFVALGIALAENKRANDASRSRHNEYVDAVLGLANKAILFHQGFMNGRRSTRLRDLGANPEAQWQEHLTELKGALDDLRAVPVSDPDVVLATRKLSAAMKPFDLLVISDVNERTEQLLIEKLSALERARDKVKERRR